VSWGQPNQFSQDFPQCYWYKSEWGRLVSRTPFQK